MTLNQFGPSFRQGQISQYSIVVKNKKACLCQNQVSDRKQKPIIHKSSCFKHLLLGQKQQNLSQHSSKYLCKNSELFLSSIILASLAHSHMLFHRVLSTSLMMIPAGTQSYTDFSKSTSWFLQYIYKHFDRHVQQFCMNFFQCFSTLNITGISPGFLRISHISNQHDEVVRVRLSVSSGHGHQKSLESLWASIM